MTEAAEAATPPRLSMRAISKAFGGQPALRQVDLDVADGEVIGLIGENGAGKSTMMKLLAGVFNDYDGEMMLHGRIDRSQLTPALSKQYPEAALKELASGLQNLGELQAIVFKGQSGSTKARAYQYLLLFPQRNVVATFTLNSSNRIAALDLSG